MQIEDLQYWYAAGPLNHFSTSVSGAAALVRKSLGISCVITYLHLKVPSSLIFLIWLLTKTDQLPFPARQYNTVRLLVQLLAK